jgi:hypothetical protein
MDLVVVIRIVNCLGCIVALTILLISGHRQWKDWNFKTRQHWLALIGWVSLGLESTLESYFLNIPGGPRTILVTLVLAWTLHAIFTNEEVRSNPWHSRKDKT